MHEARSGSGLTCWRSSLCLYCRTLSDAEVPSSHVVGVQFFYSQGSDAGVVPRIILVSDAIERNYSTQTRLKKSSITILYILTN